MKRFFCILITVLMILCLGACGGQSNDFSTPDEATITSTTETPTLPFEFTITKTEIGKDYKGNDTLFIYFDWTNTTDYTLTFDMNVIIDAFQNGAELDTTFPDMLTDLYDLYDNQSLKIKPGATQSLVLAFVLNDTENSVNLEIEGFNIPEETTIPPTTIVELN